MTSVVSLFSFWDILNAEDAEQVFSRNDLYDISELEEALYFVEIFNDYEKIGVEKIIRY